MIIKALLNPKLSVAETAGYSNSCVITRWTDHTVSTRLIANVYHATLTPFVTHLANLTFSHGSCQVSDDVIVLRHLAKQEIDTLVGLDRSLEHDANAIQPDIHINLLFAKMFLISASFRDHSTVLQLNTRRLGNCWTICRIIRPFLQAVII